MNWTIVYIPKRGDVVLIKEWRDHLGKHDCVSSRSVKNSRGEHTEVTMSLNTASRDLLFPAYTAGNTCLYFNKKTQNIPSVLLFANETHAHTQVQLTYSIALTLCETVLPINSIKPWTALWVIWCTLLAIVVHYGIEKMQFLKSETSKDFVIV